MFVPKVEAMPTPQKVVQRPSPKPDPKKARIQKEVAELKAAMKAEPQKKKPELQLPQIIQPKQAPPAVADPNYGEYLIAYLQNALDLPEYGDVKAKIEIDRFGQLVKCEILEAKNKKNAEFLKNRLPDLAFPCLNEFGIFDTTQSFTITFRNVENH